MNPFKKLAAIPSIKEIEGQIVRKASDAASKVPFKINEVLTAKRRESVRIRTLSKSLREYLNRALEVLEAIDRADVFYREFSLLFLDKNSIEESKRKLSKSIKIVNDLERSYLREISRCNDTKYLTTLRKQAYGRIISVLRRVKRQIELARSFRENMKRLPDVDRRIPTIVIAGPPNSGKSTLVRRLSTAKVEIASYPFTTKDISVGHLELNSQRLQIIDTPGLLDRPMKDRNIIERKAILCLKHLANVIIFLFDVSYERYYPPEDQINLFREICDLFKDKSIIPVVNKIDITKEESLIRVIENNLGRPLIRISAKRNIGFHDLMNRIREIFHKEDYL